MSMYQPDRHTLVIVTRPMLRWGLAALWTLFLALLLAVSWQAWTVSSGTYLLSTVMVLGGMVAFPIGLVLLAPIVTLRVDGHRRTISREWKRVWGTHRDTLAFDDVQSVRVHSRLGPNLMAHHAVIDLKAGGHWEVNQEGAVASTGPQVVVDAIRGILEPDSAPRAVTLPATDERRDLKAGGITLLAATLLSGGYLWYLFEQGGVIAMPSIQRQAAAPDTSEQVARWRASGDAEDMLYLAQAYFEGNGVSRNRALAAEWAVKSIEAGYPKASLAAGNLYERGDGVPQDRAMAHMLYTLGAEAGVQQATQARDSLEGRMSPEERALAAERLEAWKAEH